MYQIAFQLEEPDYVKLEEEESIVIRFKKKKKNSSKKYNNATLKINTEAFNRLALLSKCVDNHLQVIKANKNYTAPYKSILENSLI